MWRRPSMGRPGAGWRRSTRCSRGSTGGRDIPGSTTAGGSSSAWTPSPPATCVSPRSGPGTPAHCGASPSCSSTRQPRPPGSRRPPRSKPRPQRSGRWTTGWTTPRAPIRFAPPSPTSTDGLRSRGARPSPRRRARSRSRPSGRTRTTSTVRRWRGRTGQRRSTWTSSARRKTRPGKRSSGGPRRRTPYPRASGGGGASGGGRRPSTDSAAAPRLPPSEGGPPRRPRFRPRFDSERRST